MTALAADAAAPASSGAPAFDAAQEQGGGLRGWWRDMVALAAPVWRPVVRVLSMATGLGWGVIATTAAAGIAGAVLGWAELQAIAWIGLALLAVCAVFLVGRTGYEARLDVSRSRVVVGEAAFGVLELRNPTRRALLPVQVELPVGKGKAPFSVPRLAPGASFDADFRIPTHKRTVLQVGPITAVRGDPLGVLARVVTWSDPMDLFVHPRTVPMDGSSSGFLQDLEGLPTSKLSNSDMSFHALREYIPGDDVRHVHWMSSARTGQLLVRQFEETRRSHLAISLSLNQAEYAHEDELELGISVAGSLGLHAIRENKQLSVLVQGAALPTKSGKRFLDSLSGLTPTDPRRGSMVDLALQTGTAVPDASVAILVCGSFVTPTEVRRAASQIPIGVRIVAVYCTPGAAVTRRTIGDIVILSVGDLADLPQAMRRIVA